MTDIVDPVELLNSMSPPAGWNEPPDLSTDTRAATILERVVTGNVIPFRAPRRRLRIITGVVVTATVGATAVAAFLQRDVEEDRTLACWNDATAETIAAVPWDGTTDPAVACETVWRDGPLGTDGPPAPLQRCITDAGVVAVIPGGDDTCAQRDFGVYVPADPPDGATGNDEEADISALARMLDRKYNRDECFSAEEALDGVRRTLDEYKFDGWATQILSTSSAAEPCASPVVVRDEKTVNIVFRARPDEASN